MVLIESTHKGKSVVNANVNIAYNIKLSGSGEMEELNGVIYSEEKSVGFLSYDETRSGLQFAINNPAHGLEIADIKQIFDVFADDLVEIQTTQLNST